MSEYSQIKRFKLPNGATIIHKPTKSDETKFFIGFKGGDNLDDDYEEMTHLIEHLWFYGDTSHNKQFITKYMKNFGYPLDASTTGYYVAVNSTFPTQNFPEVISELTSMISNNKFTQTNIDRECAIIRSEFDYLKNNDYSDMDSEDLEDLDYITPSIIRKFVNKNLVSQNLVFVVESNLESEVIFNITAPYFSTKFQSNIDSEYMIESCNQKLSDNIRFANKINNYIKYNFWKPINYAELNSDEKAELYICSLYRQFYFNALSIMKNQYRNKNHLYKHIFNQSTEPGYINFSLTFECKNINEVTVTTAEILKKFKKFIPNEKVMSEFKQFADRIASKLDVSDIMSKEIILNGFYDMEIVSSKLNNITYKELKSYMDKYAFENIATEMIVPRKKCNNIIAKEYIKDYINGICEAVRPNTTKSKYLIKNIASYDKLLNSSQQQESTNPIVKEIINIEKLVCQAKFENSKQAQQTRATILRKIENLKKEMTND